MTGKAKKAPKPDEAKTTGKESRGLHAHEIMLSSTVQGAVTMDAFSKYAGKELDLGELIKGIREQFDKLNGGDTKPIEAMLYGQAKALETMFTSLSRRAMAQEYLKQFQSYMVLALKAQAQCRATLEALAEVKNPRPVAFVKQANISQGHQQVNNGTVPGPLAHAEKAEGVQNGLLPAPGAPVVTPTPIGQEREHAELDARA